MYAQRAPPLPYNSSHHSQQPVDSQSCFNQGNVVPHDSLDAELLDEANLDDYESVGSESDQDQEHLLNQNLAWAARAANPSNGLQLLNHPVLIPQSSPGIQNSFSRAWAPSLASHDVRPEEFLQFIDHLNVCKAASPPLQVLKLAGNVLGFTPIPHAALVGIATQAVAGGGMYVVAKVRLTNYLERANKEYFVPRGLKARLAKQDLLPQITGQSPDAPLLAPVQEDESDGPTTQPSFRDRRLQALQGFIAPLEFDDLSAPQQEDTALDKLSAKMLAFNVARQEKKANKERVKGREDEPKEREKLEEETRKLEEKMEKVNREADKDLRKKPEKEAKIQRKRNEELEKITRDMEKAHEEFAEKTGVSVKHEDKGARKLLWIVVENLDEGP